MYTGIVHGAYPLTGLNRKPGLHQLTLDLPAPLLVDLTIGASVGLDGVCMTVTGIDGAAVSFDAMQETLQLTTLGQRQCGDRVNVERSAKQGSEIGGHLISGHVDGTAAVVGREESENNLTLTFALPAGLAKYVFKKGFDCYQWLQFDGCRPGSAAGKLVGLLNSGDSSGDKYGRPRRRRQSKYRSGSSDPGDCGYRRAGVG